MAVKINSAFDGGNIECVDCASTENIRLQISRDAGGEFYQWFYFRMTGAANKFCHLKIENAGGSSYPRGWENYQVVVSHDKRNWYRSATEYRNGVLHFNITPPSDLSWFAYFTPYSLQQHDALISKISACNNVSLESLGTTLDGRSMDLLRIGNPNARLKIWSIARQHPGETMAQWWMEGLLERLTNNQDPVTREILKQAAFYVVPNMNPDGCFRGYLRTNACGANLNREWSNPSLEKSPEVFLVRQKMHETGVDFSLDVHGDEALPYNFIAGTEGVKSWSESRLHLQTRFKNNLQQLNPDFQTTVGYPVASAGTANYDICSSYVAEHFKCPAMTLEMPFKDTADTPDDKYGWSAGRSSALGRSFVDAIYSVLDAL
ncbi:hypothetical protein AB833_16425 [Chromatiales bacterium (ex Bugula neritina AB1)]|nr:hypothetical protein AB833_16425 [Chromatiales bacterium (ex Bugula neritina AB1)]